MSCCVLLADEKLHQGPERSTTRESGMFVKCAQVNEIVLIAIVATGIAILIAIDWINNGNSSYINSNRSAIASSSLAIYRLPKRYVRSKWVQLWHRATVEIYVGNKNLISFMRRLTPLSSWLPVYRRISSTSGSYGEARFPDWLRSAIKMAFGLAGNNTRRPRRWASTPTLFYQRCLSQLAVQSVNAYADTLCIDHI